MAKTQKVADFEAKWEKTGRQNVINLVELNEKNSLRSILKGDLPMRSFFCVLGEKDCHCKIMN